MTARTGSRRPGKRGNMFKPTTIGKYVHTMKTAVQKARADVKRRHVIFSTGNMKIGRVLNVSTAPIITCGHCNHCSGHCYDIKACLQYPGALKARANNTAIAMIDRPRFFAEIGAKMDRRRKNLYMRFHVGGEIMDMDYLERMIATAREHGARYKAIWTYTKEHALVNEYVKNHGGNKACVTDYMTIMYSHWYGTTVDNPYDFPVFWTVKTEDDIAECHANGVTWECPGNCDICKDEGRGCIVGESVYARLH